ncbi:MAG: Aspartate-semialdehyde dehydrogenase [Chlamydiia bacterium]|nr:Aspartate-semialdehyde dehydrogenase [Chlamydiia bacterium]
MLKTGLIGHKGVCGKELLKLLPTLPKLYNRNDPLDFSKIDILFMAISETQTPDIAEKAMNQGVIVIDLSSAFRRHSSYPLILPPVNLNLINNSLKLISLPNCVVSILLTALNPLTKISKIKKIIISTYQAASGAGKVGLEALKVEETITPFPCPLKDNIFLHESKKNSNGLCGEEEKIIFETRKLLNQPKLPISVRCVRLPIKRAHSIHAIVTFEQKIHNISELLRNNKHIKIHPSPHPLIAEGKEDVFVGDIREDLNEKNTYDFWIVGDQLLRGAALNAFEVYNELQNATLSTL